jgi:hypothetical protein
MQHAGNLRTIVGPDASGALGAGGPCEGLQSAHLKGRFIDYEEDGEGVVSVKNETSHLHRFLDATQMAEALYGWVEQPVRDEQLHEFEFIVGFREIPDEIPEEIESIVEPPDREANLLIKLYLQNGGRLSPTKRARHFSRLTAREVHAIEKAVQARLERFPRGQSLDHRR